MSEKKAFTCIAQREQRVIAMEGFKGASAYLPAAFLRASI